MANDIPSDGDQNKLKLALQALERKQFVKARAILEDVVTRTPADYHYHWQEKGDDFIEFWEEEEFLAYVAYARAQPSVPYDGKVVWIVNTYPRAHFTLGFIGVAEGHPDVAQAHLERSLQLEPDQPWTLCEMAHIAAGQGRHDAALELYERALAVRPWATPRQKARALRGKAYELVELVKHNPLAQASDLKAACVEGIERFTQARECLVASLDYEPDNKMAQQERSYLAGFQLEWLAEASALTDSDTSSPHCVVCGAPMAPWEEMASEGVYRCARHRQPARRWWQVWKH